VQTKQGQRAVPQPEAVGARRLVDFAQQAEVHDKRLWTPIAAAVGGQGNTTALVGTPEQVAEALLDYYDLGVTTLLIRGFDPLNDAIEYGRELIPLVRAEVARRERDRAAALAR
jgi:alkanesulfonate monooxygenase